MPRKARDVTDAELAILRILWDEDRTTVKSLAQRLYPSEPDKQVPTVQKLLGRLEEKDCVTRDRTVWPHLYTAAITRDDLVGRRLAAIADQLYDGSFAPLLRSLVRYGSLSPDDRAMLRGLLDETAQTVGVNGG